ncbi:hypothetical protein HJC23_013645 [Cyclotella cryptica]|uniref:COX assembly mitochondrial protein n=1 Tax=Cyclotella cryptica TaxID=29204 RepID=A0ABD3QWM1_9STRA
MTKLSNGDLPQISSISPSCHKLYKTFLRKKKMDTEAIGTPSYNLFLDFLRCPVKHPNIRLDTVDAKTDATSEQRKKEECIKIEKIYSMCHAAVMGVGNFNGRRHCGEEMDRLFLCLNSDYSSS